eukprot:GFUD01010912.1.p1 GENE.GFUD01010912.1~~GFUD01010912.1.p1  ORF type:complete len:480 (+),score=137.07 GFUD01010912.1:153-1592(+)
MEFKNIVFFLICVSECASSLLREGPQQREKRQFLAGDRTEKERITASGGGIVREGSNVTLSLYVGSVWDRCRWFRYDHAKADADNKIESCSFDFDEDTNTTSLHRCNAKELKSMITPLSDDPLYCKIMLVNMTGDMEGKWAARLDTEKDEEEIQLIMEENVKDIELDVTEEDVVAGANVTVSCKAVGGKPDPVLTFMLMDGDNSTENTSRFFDVNAVETDGENTVKYQAIFVPEIDDLGKTLCCKAVQKDMENNTLYETNKVLDKSLDVSFSPQPVQPDGIIELEAKIGETASLSLLFRANPAPDTAAWSIIRTGNCSEDDSDSEASSALPLCKIEINPGHNDDKYIASQITKAEGANHTFLLDLQVLNVDALDYTNNYSAAVTNSAGLQTYSFHLTENLPSTKAANIGSSTESLKTEITGEGMPGTDNGEDPESGGSPGLTVLMVIFFLMGIIGGIVFYKKRRGTDIEQTPLTNTHTP